MNPRFLCPVALCAISCVRDLQSNSHDYQVFHGTVRNMSTGGTLLTFCHGLGIDRSQVVVFSAPAGSVVEEEVLFEGRLEKYRGGMPPVRDEAFGCSAAPEVSFRPGDVWTCLRAADPDPPATILSVDRRGELLDKDGSSGYALKLEVRHPGVLHVVFDAPCLIQHGSSISDALVPGVEGELTIQ